MKSQATLQVPRLDWCSIKVMQISDSGVDCMKVASPPVCCLRRYQQWENNMMLICDLGMRPHSLTNDLWKFVQDPLVATLIEHAQLANNRTRATPHCPVCTLVNNYSGAFSRESKFHEPEPIFCTSYPVLNSLPSSYKYIMKIHLQRKSKPQLCETEGMWLIIGNRE